MRLKVLVLLIPLALYGVGYLLPNLFELTGICLGGHLGARRGAEICYSEPTEVARALQAFAPYLLATSTLLFFSAKEVIYLWYQKFVFWAGPLGVIWFFVIQNELNSSFPQVIPGTMWAFNIFGTFFLMVSALIIFFSNRNK